MPVNIGLVGLGFMAATHVKALRQVPQARLAALCNPSGRHLDGDFTDVSGNLRVTEPLKVDMTQVKAYRDFDQMLADPDIQLVDICAPTPAHAGLAIAALRAGKHVLCEKPLARTSALARQIAAAAAEANTFCMPAMCLRFWPEWAWLKEAIDGQTYGRPLAARFRRVAEPPGWGKAHFLDGAKSGGALLDLHVHDADFIQYCFGPTRAVYATGYTRFSGVIDHVVAQFQVGSRAIVHAEGSWAMAPGFGFNMAYTVNFESATADYDLARGPEALKLYEKGRPARTISCQGPDGFVGELSYLTGCIRAGQPPSIVTVQDGVASVELCEAEERSIQTGQPTALLGSEARSVPASPPPRPENSADPHHSGTNAPRGSPPSS